jgi:transaldolase
MQLAIEDLQAAADVFADVHARTDGVDGWVSLEVSPLLAYDAQSTIDAAVEVHQRLARPNVFIKIPGTPQGLPAVEEAIYRGIPVNVTLLFSVKQYLDCVAAYQRGIMRRIAEGLDADVASVASVFISRWDAAVVGRVPAELTGKLALAVGESVHHAYVRMLNDTTQQTIATSGGRPQRLLFASTSTKDPSASDTLYVEGLIAPNTINTMPDVTLQAFADHGRVGRILDGSGGTSQAVLGTFAEHGIDVPTLGVELQEQGAQAFVTAWQDLMQVLARS